MRMITQTMMQAYERCRRFYYLKYVRELAWPAVIRDRESAREGADFHLLVRQLIMGFPKESLVFPPDDPEIEKKIASWIRSKPLAGFDRVWAEQEVTALFEETLLLGKFDALALGGDRLTIFDWKTTDRKPDLSAYAASPQTRLYRWLCRKASARLLGLSEGFPAENIEMVYWFPSFPDQPVRLPYSEQAFAEDCTWLKMKIRELSIPNEEDYPETDKKRYCGNCVYHAYCHPEEASVFGRSAAEPSGEEPPSDDIFQAGFEFPEFPEDEDREAVIY